MSKKSSMKKTSKPVESFGNMHGYLGAAAGALKEGHTKVAGDLDMYDNERNVKRMGRDATPMEISENGQKASQEKN